MSRKAKLWTSVAAILGILGLWQCANLSKEGRRQAAYAAASQGDTRQLARLLDGGIHPNTYVRYEPDFWMVRNTLNRKDDIYFAHPLLHAAARSGRIDTVEMLLERGANINYADAAGVTPLTIAVWAKDETMVKLLLDQGADPYAAVKVSEIPRSDVPAIQSLLEDARADWKKRGLPSKRHRIKSSYRIVPR